MSTYRRDRDQVTRQLSEAIGAQIQERLLGMTGRPRLPDGVVTVLFTDVEGSTSLVRALGDEQARALLRRHDEEIRRAIQANDGIEVERAGDSFFAAFRLPRQALTCALDIQRSFPEQSTNRPISDPREDRPISEPHEDDRPIRVRIGMDTGETIAEEKGYFGQTVIRASRIAELAAGGQTFASEVTKLLGDRANFTFIDHGEQELKGLGGGHRVFELVGRPLSTR